MNFMTSPKHKLTLGTTPYECEILTEAKVICRENGFDIATIAISNEGDVYPDVVTIDTAVKLEVTNEGESYPTNPMFKGVCRFPIENKEQKDTVTLSCLGSGYGLGEMIVANEYGAQSKNSGLDTIAEIINDATNGIIDQYVNMILASATNSGFGYTTTSVDAVTGTINYVDFPYKPADKCLNDLVDIVTALKAGAAGPHWIVTTDDKLRLKAVSGTQAGWTHYYGDSQSASALNYGEDYENANAEKMGAEANYIIYYGLFRRPSNGDAWTQAHTGWGKSDRITLSTDTTYFAVGTASVKALKNADGLPLRWYYPSAKTAGWDFTSFGSTQYIPTLNFMAYRSGLTSITVYLFTDDTHASRVTLYNSVGGPSMDGNDWISFSIPVGENWRTKSGNTWRWITEAANPVTWSNVNWIEFGLTGVVNEYALIDGLHFGNVPICRVAWNSDLPGNVAKMRLIVDNIGKDDSLVASDDSGLMAQLAYAELLRLQKTTILTTLKCDMLPEALPGQCFYVDSADARATQLTHEIRGKNYTTAFQLTDDLTNGRCRARYEDLNKQYANLRPEFQDRQASNIKAGTVDWRITRLVKDYAP